MTQTIRVQLRRPHSDGQRELITWPGSIALFAGRRYGKTDAGTQRILRCCTIDPGLYWWVGLSWKSASMKRAWRLLKWYTRRIYKAAGLDVAGKIREVDKEIHLPNGAEIWLRTAERPESLAGEGPAGVVMDEFSLMSKAVWEEYVQPSLLDRGGWAMLMGVPKGRNWAAQLFAQAADREGWIQRHYTSYDNPTIPSARIDELCDNMTDLLKRQEIMAEIVDDAGSVFRGVMKAATALPQSERVMSYPQPYDSNEEPAWHSYVMGVDWGRHNDYTVITVIDVDTKELVHIDRFSRVDYDFQVARLRAIYDAFKPSIIRPESNSMGGPLAERLGRSGMPVVPFGTQEATKRVAIEALSLAIERGDLRILNDPVLVGELQAFEMQRMRSGAFSYAAPSGMHDDTVMSLAIAWSAVSGQIDGPLAVFEWDSETES